MATKKKKSKRVTKRIKPQGEPWGKDGLPLGTVTVTLSLARVEEMASSFMKNARDPKMRPVLQKILGSILEELDKPPKGKVKKRAAAAEEVKGNTKQGLN